MSRTPDLADVIRKLATGTPVDWTVADGADATQTTRAVLRGLRLVARVAEVHGTLRDAASAARDDEPAGDSTASDDTQPNTRMWGPLTLLERVGHGSYGNVYRAWDARLDREVALKLLRRDPSAAATTVVEEGRLLARVRHPNVVTVYGADRIDGHVGIWMEFLEGHTLEELVREQGPFQPREALAIGIELCRGLAAVHEAGLVHGDIKAHNVMREDSGRIVLMDFGTGQRAHEAAGNQLAGTPLYIAPEILDGRHVSPRSDVYSLGVLLYHLLSGDYPVRGSSLGEVHEAHRDGRRDLLKAGTPGLTPRMRRVIDRALATDPEARFDGVRALESALTEATAPPAATPRRRRAVVGGVAALVATAAIAIGVAMARRDAVDSAQARLGFQPRDSVLITKFENLTGEPVFDGAVEYALQREFSGSDVVGLVPEERIDDALRLMKRPRDTVIDRTVGREVALRDGHIKALLAGRVERFGLNYAITAQLIDPADGAVVTTIGEEAKGQDGVLAALRREASRVRIALGESRDRIKGGDPNIEPGATKSLLAFQLYNESYQLGRQGQWPAALDVARQVVATDPDFASGWIWLAWSVRNAEQLPWLPPGDPRISKYRSFVERALQLSNTAPEWEQHWITGSYFTLLGDDARAIPHYQALLRLRPDHYYGFNNLESALTRVVPFDNQMYVALVRTKAERHPNEPGANASAAVSVIVETGRPKAAQPYMDRLNTLARTEQGLALGAAFWRDFTMAFGLWFAGDLPGTLEQVRSIQQSFERYPSRAHESTVLGVVNYYLSLGRVDDASRFVASLRSPKEQQLGQLALAWELGDGPALRRLVRPYGDRKPIQLISGSMYVRAGLFDLAERIAAQEAGPLRSASAEIVHGQILQLNRQSEQAIAPLQHGLELLAFANRPEYWWACQSLSDALWSTGKQQEAVVTLDSCSRNYAKTIGVYSPMGNFRMSADLQLSGRYRELGRLAEAQEIEQHVGRQLALADPDFPLVRELQRRR